jgi:Retroviral aspartyl protease
VLSQTRAILDTGTGPNLIREDQLPIDWERYRVTCAEEHPIVGAGGRRLHLEGTVTLVVEFWKNSFKTRFLVVKGLAADCILGCLFINRYVAAILIKEKFVRLSDSSSIPILKDSDHLTPLDVP